MVFATPETLNQFGLICGFVGSILLALSTKVGIISKDGSIISSGLDPMDSVSKNMAKVYTSHSRHRYLQPIGWTLLALAFGLQFIATCI